MNDNVFIAGSGTFLPGLPIPFDETGAVLGELTGAPLPIQRWIRNTTAVMKELLDIRYCHYAIDPHTRAFTEDNITMAVKASRAALDMAGMSPADIDLICYGSAHQDQMPTASVRIQEALGIPQCEELSIHANCTSAYKALYLAHQLIASGRNRTALVVSANMASSELRAEYYNQEKVDKESLFLRWFLCDGAGALILTGDPGRSSGYRMLHSYIESVGGNRPSLMFNHRPAYWMNPADEYEQARHHLRQSFGSNLSTAVFREEGGSVFYNGFLRMLSRAQINPRDIALFQVNLPAKHIVDSVMDECAALGIPRERFFTAMSDLGYCGPPMALICLDRIIRGGMLDKNGIAASFVTEVSKFMQAGYILQRTP